ncbi:MAG TPA: methyltransferase domain-containing protein [Anaerolineales bacterium]
MSATELYMRVREREGRLYPDDIAIHLPDLPKGHPLAGEWRARAASLQRLAHYIARLPTPMRILELGTGNGWLSHGLSAVPGNWIWGLDRESSELAQAARLFKSKTVAFLAGDIFRAPFRDAGFDLVIVASAIQYFADLPELIDQLRRLLTPRGELHILDSPLYQLTEVQAARERSEAYYASIGLPEMSACYFHHTFAEVEAFSPNWLYRPASPGPSLRRFLGKTDSPFPWFRIGKSA